MNPELQTDLTTTQWLSVLFGRILGFIMCGTPAVGLPIYIVYALTTFSLDWLEIVALLFCGPVFAGIGLGGCWLILRGIRNDTENCARPMFSADSLICQHSPTFGRPSAVILDHRTRQIHFHRCHRTPGFFGMLQVWWSCPLTDVTKAFRRVIEDPRQPHRSNPCFVIQTRTGRVHVWPWMTNYEALCQHFDAVERIIP